MQAPPGLASKFIELLFSERGHSLVSLAIGIASRTTVLAVAEAMDESSMRRAARGDGSGQGDDPLAACTHAALRLMTDPAGQRALSSFIATFVSCGVGTYIDKTSGYNYYEDLVASVATPTNRAAVEQISATVTREAIDAFFTFSRSPKQPVSTTEITPEALAGVSRSLTYESAGNVTVHGAKHPQTVSVINQEHQGGGMVQQVLQAVTSQEGRRLVSEVAGSVSAEAVRALVASISEAMGWRMMKLGAVNGSKGSGCGSSSMSSSEGIHGDVLHVAQEGVGAWGPCERIYIVLVLVLIAMACFLAYSYASLCPDSIDQLQGAWEAEL